MMANEFIKKFGLNSFKVAMMCPQFNRYEYAILYSDEVDFSNEFIEKHKDYMFETVEIKRYVDAYELVQAHGGIESIWVQNSGSIMLRDFVHGIDEAVKLVEECQ